MHDLSRSLDQLSHSAVIVDMADRRLQPCIRPVSLRAEPRAEVAGEPEDDHAVNAADRRTRLPSHLYRVARGATLNTWPQLEQ